jgi:hypothetical protein
MSKPVKVRVFCPNCRNEVLVPPERMTEVGVCTHCNQQFRPRLYIRLICPGCQSPLDIRKEYLGRSVSCKHCRRGFIATTPAENSSEFPTSSPAEPTAAPRVAKTSPHINPVGDSAAVEPQPAQAESPRPRAELESALIWKRRAEVAELERDLARGEWDSTLAERNSTLAERDALQLRLDESLGQLETLNAEHETAIHEVYESTNAECVALLADLDTERHAREHLEAARAELEADLEAIRSESDSIRAELVEARQRLAEADFHRPEVDLAKQAEIDQLTRDLAYAREREDSERQAKERVEAARAELESDLEILYRENEGFRNLVEARQHLAETDLRRPDLDRERQAEIEQLTRDLALARERENSERQARERLEAARAGIEADLQSIRQESEGYRRDLVEGWRRLAETETRLTEADPDKQAEFEQLTRDLDLARERENSEREAKERLEAARMALETDLETLRREGEGIRTDLLEAQRRLAEAESSRPEGQTQIEQLTRDLAEAREREESERQARERLEAARAALEGDLEVLHREGEGIRTDLLEAQRRLAEADSRSPEVAPEKQAEIDQLTRDLAQARERKESERQAKERLEAARAAMEGDLEALRQQGEGLRSDLDEARQRLAEADSHRAEIDQLTRDLTLVQGREDEANGWVESLNDKIQALLGELDREKASRERENAQYKRILAHLEKEVEAAGARAGKPISSEPRQSEMLERLRAATERGDRLEAELQATRTRLTAVSRDLALAQMYDEDDAGEQRSTPAERSEELKDAQLRIMQLTEELKRSNQANQKLKDTLDGIGIRFS